MYHLPCKRDEVSRKHQEVVDKLLIANNAILLYIDKTKTVRMTDLQLKDFTTKIDALQPPLKGDIVLNSLIAVTEMIGQYLVIKFISNIATIKGLDQL